MRAVLLGVPVGGGRACALCARASQGTSPPSRELFTRHVAAFESTTQDAPPPGCKSARAAEGALSHGAGSNCSTPAAVTKCELCRGKRFNCCHVVGFSILLPEGLIREDHGVCPLQLWRGYPGWPRRHLKHRRGTMGNATVGRLWNAIDALGSCSWCEQVLVRHRDPTQHHLPVRCLMACANSGEGVPDVQERGTHMLDELQLALLNHNAAP